MYEYLPFRLLRPDIDNPCNWLVLREDLMALVRDHHFILVPKNLDDTQKRFYTHFSWCDVYQSLLHNTPCQPKPSVPAFLYARFARAVYGIAWGRMQNARDLHEDVNWMASPCKGVWQLVEWRKKKWHWVGGDVADEFEQEVDTESGSEEYEFEPMSD
jgi:hypothetical protein